MKRKIIGLISQNGEIPEIYLITPIKFNEMKKRVEQALETEQIEFKDNKYDIHTKFLTFLFRHTPTQEVKHISYSHDDIRHINVAKMANALEQSKKDEHETV